VVMSNPDDKGEVTIPADIEGGEVKVRIDGSYLTEALRACGGMVDLRIADGKSPVLFETDGYKLVTMPMLTSESPKTETETEEPAQEPTEEPTEPEAENTEPVAEAEGNGSKPRRKRKAKELVAVA